MLLSGRGRGMIREARYSHDIMLLCERGRSNQIKSNHGSRKKRALERKTERAFVLYYLLSHFLVIFTTRRIEGVAIDNTSKSKLQWTPPPTAQPIIKTVL